MTEGIVFERSLAYHNDPKLKEQFVAEMERHRRLDMIAQTSTGREVDGVWRGCHVACAVHSMSIINRQSYQPYCHRLWRDLLGLPVWVAYLCEYIFEGLPPALAREFPVAFSKAVVCGSDLGKIQAPFTLYLLQLLHECCSPQFQPHIEEAVRLWTLAESRQDVTLPAWQNAAAAASAAAWAASHSLQNAIPTDQVRIDELAMRATTWSCSQAMNSYGIGSVVAATKAVAGYAKKPISIESLRDKFMGLVTGLQPEEPNVNETAGLSQPA